ncbi:glycosyltransferase family 2 protein [Salinicola peritrichatus]|uniref:glycosyltransferase family 2 protein n=1 Tax=Salinicola peritrichatus TaxID=1267424 RepID=UPI000DA16097|nr:glycosyltransferase family 2 protein [Salinicola peritrichatus]
MTKPLFKICAVAKDEGPYLAEWVFHHLHFGFDRIHVYLNRTSDASAAVLDRIARNHFQVTYEYID